HVRAPLILFAAKGGNTELARKLRRTGFVFENDVHGLCIQLILINQHERPLPIGSQYRIGGDERVASAVLYVAHAAKDLVLPAPRLDPFLRDEFTSKVL